MTEECHARENGGHCADHPFEAERRRTSQRDIDTINSEIADIRARMNDIVEDHIGGLLTFKNRIVGASIFGSVIMCFVFGGSYMFTFMHIGQSEVEHAELRSEVDTLEDNLRSDIEMIEDDVGDVKTDVALANERYSNILAAQNDTKAEVRSVKTEIRELANVLRDEGRITRVKLLEQQNGQ